MAITIQTLPGDQILSRSKSQALAKERWIAEIVAAHTAAAIRSTWDGKDLTPYFFSCKHVNPFRGITSIFTRDVGYHTSGWWKNPDYERCYHLSLSFFDPVTNEPAPHDHKTAQQFVRAFFRSYAKWVWTEPPYSAQGKQQDIYHYRLFCDEFWQPLKPRGEVYSRELTEAGWKSFSDVQDAKKRHDI